MTFPSPGLRVLLLLVLTTIVLALDVESAYAQANQCGRLQSALAQFDRNGEFRQVNQNTNAARQLGRQVQDAESRYIRQGCNDDARAGRILTQECQLIARDVIALRNQYAALAQAVETGNAVAQQREAILQEMARFGCNAGSSATFSQDRQSIFDRIFGSTTGGDFTDGDFVDGGNWGYQGYHTVRTVCVRLSDGYFWPISYATLSEYVGNDAMACQQMCPNTPVELYFYDNPGQEPEQMRNLSGSPYTSLPNAFAYRTNFDNDSSCTAAPVADGSVRVAESADGSGRAIVEINGVNFPLPLRDPRGVVPVQAVAAAEPVANVALVDVPLPRPRPSGPGEIARRPEAPAPAEMRIVHFGDKAVRVVGPDTPYAQAGRAGT